MSKVCVAGFGLSLDGFSAGIEQSLSDPLGNRGRFGDRHCGCGGRVAGDCRSLARIGLGLEIVNSDGCGVRGTN